MQRILAAAAALAVVLALAFWVTRTHPAQPLPVVELDHGRPRPQGDAFVVAFAALPPHLNPWTTSDAVARRWVLRYTHDALLAFDARTGELAPALAVSAEPQGDGRTFVLQLRDGVHFSDGTPLRMEDVMFTWELARGEHDLGGSVWTDLRLLESVEALDDHRLRLVLAERHFAGLGLAATSFVVVQRRWFVEAVRARAARAGEPPPAPGDRAFATWLRQVELPGPGTGPYELARDPRTGEVRWPAGDELLMVQNPRSWRRSAQPEHWNLAALRLVRVADAAASRARLRGESIDWAEDDDPAATLASDPILAAHYVPCVYAPRTQGPVFVVWNHERPWLGDRNVRTALTMSFDRAAIVAMVGPRARPAVSWFPPGSAREGDVPQPAFDPEGAHRLLEQAGVVGSGPAPELTILVDGSGGPDLERLVDVAIPAFAKAGVALHKEVVVSQVLAQRVGARDFDAFLYAWNPDPFNDPTEVFHSTQGHNWMHYRSAEMDEVLEKARTELDDAARVELYHEFNRIFARDQPMTLLYHRRSCGLLHRRFRGVEIGEMGLIPRSWWVEPDEQLHRFASSVQQPAK